MSCDTYWFLVGKPEGKGSFGRSKRRYEYSTKICLKSLTPNEDYSGRIAPLTSKRCILYIYSTNIGTEYFIHGIYSQFFLFKMQFVS